MPAIAKSNVADRLMSKALDLLSKSMFTLRLVGFFGALGLNKGSIVAASVKVVTHYAHGKGCFGGLFWGSSLALYQRLDKLS